MFPHDVSIEKSTNVRFYIFQMFNSILSRLVPSLAARFAERVFVTPTPRRRPRRESAWAEGAIRTSIPSPLGPIPLWVWGEGPGTILLVHGWSGRGLQLAAFVEPLLRQGIRVVTYDAPGHGDARGRTSSMPAFATALGAVARRFAPVKAVIAHSLGCASTLYAHVQRELIAERLVMISPASRLHAIRERFGDMTGFPPPIIDRMRRGLERRLGLDWEESEPLRIARTLEMPLLVIHDSGDRLIPHREGAELADAWPDGRLITTTGLGHHRILRDPEVIASAVAFISENPAHIRMERRAS